MGDLGWPSCLVLFGILCFLEDKFHYYNEKQNNQNTVHLQTSCTCNTSCCQPLTAWNCSIKTRILQFQAVKLKNKYLYYSHIKQITCANHVHMIHVLCISHQVAAVDVDVPVTTALLPLYSIVIRTDHCILLRLKRRSKPATTLSKLNLNWMMMNWSFITRIIKWRQM